MVTQGRGDGHEQYTTKYTVNVSTDGTHWESIDGGAEFAGNTAATVYAYAWFNSPALARYVRIYPTEFEVYPSLRAAVFVNCEPLSPPVTCA